MEKDNDMHTMEYYSALKRGKYCHLQHCRGAGRHATQVKKVRHRKTNTTFVQHKKS
jgi:hypothetical protein